MQAPRSSSGPKNDINVTPLVDVVLVLLIIFMVVTPMLQRGAEAELPLTEHPIKATSMDDQITITVQQSGALYWEADAKSEQEIAALLAEAYRKSNGNAPIFVKGDKGAPYAKVRLVMKMVQESGFARVGIITKELKEGA